MSSEIYKKLPNSYKAFASRRSEVNGLTAVKFAWPLCGAHSQDSCSLFLFRENDPQPYVKQEAPLKKATLNRRFTPQ